MTTGYLGSTELTNVLLGLLIVVLALTSWLVLFRRARPPDLLSRVRLIEKLLEPRETPSSAMRTWLVAETALLVQLASLCGVQMLEAEDPAWELIRTRKLEQLAAEDPTFLERIKQRFLSLPEPVRAFLMELLKKLNGALEHMIPLGDKSPRT